MNIPSDAIIPYEKLTAYLRVFREEDDKSGVLAQGGFTLDNSDMLEMAIRQQVATANAEIDRENQYGNFYRVQGELIGINGRILNVVTVWLEERATGVVRFVTLKPWRKSRDET
ncbi:MAG: hypothetical protein IT324_04225 [Anaerolineae bacterium]|nr:hypothetical protein [Anaerolineae bacterium]